MRHLLAASALAAVFFLCQAAVPGLAAAPALESGPDAPDMPAPPIPAPAGPAPDPDGDRPPAFLTRPHAARPVPQPDQTFAARPAPAEFRGLPWGLPVEAAKARGLVPVTRPVALPNTYARPDETLSLGQAQVLTVAYYFPKGRLSGVGIVFEGQSNFFLVKDHLMGLYGPGRQMGDRYGWTWPSFFIDLRMRGNMGELRYSHEP